MKLSVETERFRLKRPFRISRGMRREACVLTVRIERDDDTGTGECVPYGRYGETVESVRDSILSLVPPFDRTELDSLLPPGAARNALDCALWDLEAKNSDLPVWKCAGLSPPKPLMTACTISLGSPEEMYEESATRADFPLLKVKLGPSSQSSDQLAAVRDGAPDSRLIVDVNEGWDFEELYRLASELVRFGVEMVEQPLPAGQDNQLAEEQFPFSICADESCHTIDSLEVLPAGYDMINIKLDKTGGLTAALKLKRQAQLLGYKIMVGSMMSSSLAIAPAILVAQDIQIVDLDGPLMLSEDRNDPLHYCDGKVYPADQALWG
ncbi:MAG: dipeptide epimerase [Rhodobacteraceae bacterium]|nr:dipeptide epimerase [Paracoccaceae bacterium]MCY4197653.1 dipeptide epimerase [Paracoccaceae bacterium]MCY4326212.1 dipeptide epimerase [Paracoccaceae bacterium]